ncbi:MAG: LCP family protein [Lachnospiraceae bacterium]|nr:LCP family protein [Lachnospiraceae bacterium]
MANRKRSGSKSGKIVIFAIEFLIIAVLLFVLIKFVIPATKTTETGGLNVVKIDETKPEEIGISEEVQQMTEEGGSMSPYLNIAFFGIDATSTSVSALEKGYRSDSIMICSINQDTGDVKLCSVYRDTYLNTGKDTYQKCNAAYALGGGNAAVSMLNSNLDLDITNWMSVSYRGLSDAIDSLGGIYLDIDEAEIGHLNAYQSAIADILKEKYVPLSETGYQKVNGMQAAAYCRIRYTAGDDFKRAERQREVLQGIMDAAKGADSDKLVATFNKVSGSVLTSIDSETLLSMVKNIANYKIVDEGGFPEESLRTTGTIGAKGSCVIPVDLSKNVIWLHKFLFNDEDYTPSETVQSYSSVIYSDTSKYLGY